MPTVSRKASLEASPERVYDIVADPSRQPDWWPRVHRVEDVLGRAGAARSRWTSVLKADSGRLIRMDFRSTAANRPARYEWEQELAGSPFEKHLARQAVLVEIEPGEGGSVVTLTATHQLRGTAKLAGFAMRKNQRRLLDQALGKLATAVDRPGGTDG